MEIIDSHHHFWHYDPVNYAWIDERMKVIQRDFLPEHFKPVLEENGVTGTIVVQADSSVAETHFLLEKAAENDFIKGVVGWIDLCSETLEKKLDALAHETKLVGFRHIVQGEENPLFVLDPKFRRGLEIIFERGYTYDLLIYPHQLISALELIRHFPNHPIVIDHIAKPYIARGYVDGWAVMMREIARYDQVFCKVSGMVTEAEWNTWEPSDIKPYLDVVTDCFAPERLMYGSDWPVLNVAGNYEQVIDLVLKYIESWPEEDQRQIMGETARSFYLSKDV